MEGLELCPGDTCCPQNFANNRRLDEVRHAAVSTELSANVACVDANDDVAPHILVNTANTSGRRINRTARRTRGGHCLVRHAFTFVLSSGGVVVLRIARNDSRTKDWPLIQFVVDGWITREEDLITWSDGRHELFFGG